MAQFYCVLGCVDAQTGKPKLHPALRFCPRELGIRRQTGRWRPGAGKVPLSQETGTPPAAQAAPSPGAPAPAPAAPPKPEAAGRSTKGINIGYKPAMVVGPGVEMKAGGEVNLDWEISEQTCEKFWGTVLSGIEQILDFTCDVLLQIPKVPPEVFQLDEGQKYVVRSSFRGVTTNILQKVFRAKTPEEADKVVAGLGGVVGFGLMGLKIAWHFIKEAPKSPRLAKLREKRKEIAAKRLQAELEARTAKGEAVAIVDGKLVRTDVVPPRAAPGVAPG